MGNASETARAVPPETQKQTEAHTKGENRGIFPNKINKLQPQKQSLNVKQR